MSRAMTEAEAESRRAWTDQLDQRLRETVAHAFVLKNKAWPTEEQIQARMTEIKAAEAARLLELDGGLNARSAEALRD